MVKGSIDIEAINDILTENERRNAIVYAKFNPITGEGSVGKRVKCTISDFPIHTQWLPERTACTPTHRSWFYFQIPHGLHGRGRQSG